MPTTLNPSGSYGAGTVTAPVGGEARSSASVRIGFQQLLDMVGFIKARLDGGVIKVRTVATVAALKAVTGQTTGDHAIVKDLGLYEFDGASAIASNDVTVITPTAGGGRWLHVNRSATVANGFAPLDSGAKVPNANLRGVLSQSQSASPAAASGTMGGQIHVVYASALSLTLAVGEVWMVCGRMSFSMSGAGFLATEDLQAYFDVVLPDTSTVEVPGARATLPRANSSTDKLVGLCGIFRATQAGTHALRLLLRYSAVPSTVNYNFSSAPVFEAHRLSAP